MFELGNNLDRTCDWSITHWPDVFPRTSVRTSTLASAVAGMLLPHWVSTFQRPVLAALSLWRANWWRALYTRAEWGLLGSACRNWDHTNCAHNPESICSPGIIPTYWPPFLCNEWPSVAIDTLSSHSEVTWRLPFGIAHCCPLSVVHCYSVSISRWGLH